MDDIIERLQENMRKNGQMESGDGVIATVIIMITGQIALILSLSVWLQEK